MYEIFDHHEEFIRRLRGGGERLVREDRKAVAIPAYRGNFRILYRTDDKIVREHIQNLWKYFMITFFGTVTIALVGFGAVALVIRVGEVPPVWFVGVVAVATIAAAGIFAVSFRETVDSVLDKYDRYPEKIAVGVEDEADGQEADG